MSTTTDILGRDLESLARRLAEKIAKAHDSKEEARPGFLIFRVGGLRFRLPLEVVREVVLPLPLFRVPRAPDSILGVMNLRGRVLTVVDLAMVISHSPRAQAAGVDQLSSAETGKGDRRVRDQDQRFVLLDLLGREVAVKVDLVESISSEPDGGDWGAQGMEDGQEPFCEIDPHSLAEFIEALVV